MRAVIGLREVAARDGWMRASMRGRAKCARRAARGSLGLASSRGAASRKTAGMQGLTMKGLLTKLMSHQRSLRLNDGVKIECFCGFVCDNSQPTKASHARLRPVFFCSSRRRIARRACRRPSQSPCKSFFPHQTPAFPFPINPWRTPTRTKRRRSSSASSRPPHAPTPWPPSSCVRRRRPPARRQHRRLRRADSFLRSRRARRRRRSERTTRLTSRLPPRRRTRTTPCFRWPQLCASPRRPCRRKRVRPRRPRRPRSALRTSGGRTRTKWCARRCTSTSSASRRASPPRVSR